MNETAIKVDVPLDMKVLEFYKLAQMIIDMPAKKTDEINTKAKEYKNKIKDNVVRDNVGHLYKGLAEIKGVLNHIRLEKAVTDFESSLYERTGRHYEINLIADGNL